MSVPTDECWIRSIVSTRAKFGATVEEIKDDFFKAVGKPMPHAHQGSKAIEVYLNNVKDLHVELRNGTKLYYCDNQKHEHIRKLVSAQRTQSVSKKRFRDSGRERNQSFVRTQTYHSNNGRRNNENSERESKIRKLSDSTNRRIKTETFSIAEKWRRTVDLHTVWHNPTLLSRRMVGDDFFLNLARYELYYKCTPNQNVIQSGLCISGQTIRDAAERILTLPKSGDLLINIGSVDLLQGHDLFTMIEDTFYLLECCQKQEIVPVLTTLAPIANRLHNETVTKQLLQYNSFLQASKVNVIDLYSQFVDQEESVDFGFFYNHSTNVSGSSLAHLQWSKIGRTIALRQLKRQLVAWDFGNYLNTVLNCF